MISRKPILIRSVPLILGAMGLFLLAACDSDENDPAGPDGASGTPTPVATHSTSYQMIVQPREDGLYCIRDGAESQVIPWPMTAGLSFYSTAPDCDNDRSVQVLSTDRSYTCDAGTFEHTLMVGYGNGYSSFDFIFAEGYGLLGWASMAGRASYNTSLTRYSISPGQSALDDRYGLGPGNRWEFAIHNNDSNGSYITEGTETRVCSSKTTLFGHDVYVIQVTIETRTWQPGGASDPSRPCGAASPFCCAKQGGSTNHCWFLQK